MRVIVSIFWWIYSFYDKFQITLTPFRWVFRLMYRLTMEAICQTLLSRNCSQIDGRDPRPPKHHQNTTRNWISPTSSSHPYPRPPPASIWLWDNRQVRRITRYTTPTARFDHLIIHNATPIPQQQIWQKVRNRRFHQGRQVARRAWEEESTSTLFV